MSSDSDIPTQVRIRTDPAEGHSHRYDTIQDAKDVFNAGNNTQAILAACEHARRDRKAKERVLEWASRELSGEQRDALLELLSTPDMKLKAESRSWIYTE